jgi:hypothetical protein
VPAVSQENVLAGLRIGAPPGPAAPVLIDPQVRHRRGRLQQRVRARGDTGSIRAT